MISVITITNRFGGIDVNWSALKKQTFTDFEWIFCDTLYGRRHSALVDYTKNDSRVRHIQQSQKDIRAKTWLNHAENQAIRVARGELVVLLQDYIHIRPNALEMFWTQYQTNKKLMISGTGHQYGRPGKEDIADPKGLITIFKEPSTGRPEVVVWQDPRMRFDMGSFYACRPEDIEFNFCAVPLQAFYDVGGCDEEYDYVGHAYDNCSVAVRAFSIGYEPYIDQTNNSFSIRHDDFFDTKVKVNDANEIANFHVNRMKEILSGRRPIKYNYLDNKS